MVGKVKQAIRWKRIGSATTGSEAAVGDIEGECGAVGAGQFLAVEAAAEIVDGMGEVIGLKRGIGGDGEGMAFGENAEFGYACSVAIFLRHDVGQFDLVETERIEPMACGGAAV